MWPIHHAPQTGLAALSGSAVPAREGSQSHLVTSCHRHGQSLGNPVLLSAPARRKAPRYQRELCALLAADLVSLNSKATAQHCNYLARYI